MFISDADSSLISARSETTDDQVRGEPAVHADAEPGLGVGQAPVAVQQQFLVAGEPGLVPGQHALQGQVRGGGPQPGRVGRGVRLDVRHAPAR